MAVVRAAATEPIALTVAVLFFGVVARLGRPFLDKGIQFLRAAMPARLHIPDADCLSGPAIQCDYSRDRRPAAGRSDRDA